ncbi:MAG: gluconate 2-dehydrogenase subunit 3 family protein, partial [Bacteroidota bacterium]
QMKELLTEIDAEAKAHAEEMEPGDKANYFSVMKQLTLWGYFTSEIGATQALRYIDVPGKYDGEYPYKKGDRAWAT